MKRNDLNNLALLLFVGLIISSCGPFRKPRPGEPGSAELFELAWVHPRVIKADQYFTLIIAERLDSFLVAREKAQPVGPPTVVFRIDQPNCAVKAELGSSYGSFRAPLFSETLEPGIYKLTLNPAQYSSDELPPGQYTVTVRFCSLVRETRFFRD